VPTAEPLPRRPFGPTGLLVTPICIGCAPLGNMPETFAYEVPAEQALATLRAAFQSPLNFVDTAAAYGDGESERRIGRVLRELGGLPPGYVLATKADRDLHTGDFSGEQVRRSVERSLRLLGLQRLQLVYLHDPEHTTFEQVMAPGGPLEVLLRFRQQGIIEHVGVAGGPIDLMIRYVETGLFEAVITHNRYTLLNRTAAPLLDVAAARGLAVANAAPYGSGLLAKGPDAYPRYAYQDAPPNLVERTRRMADMCRRYDVPLAAAALQFSLRDPRIASTIVGLTRPERIAQTLDLARHPIPNELWPLLDQLAVRKGDPEASRWLRSRDGPAH
jgi:D-threo-aldose 1-dehydrogenase